MRGDPFGADLIAGEDLAVEKARIPPQQHIPQIEDDVQTAFRHG